MAPASDPVPKPAEPATRLQLLLRKSGKGPWALVDQVLMSGTNFATMVLVARGVSREAFGEFTLAYAVLFFVASIQSGIITQPHNVLATTKRGRAYRRFTRTMALLQALLIGVSVLLVLAVWGGASALGWSWATLLVPLAAGLAAWQLQEFVRRVFYTEARLAAATFNDLVSYGGQTVVIAALWYTQQLTPERALWALAATSLLAALFGLFQLRRSLWARLTRATVRKDAGEALTFGKWIVATDLVGTWLSTQLLVVATALILGTAATALLKAVHTLFGPTRIVAFALNTVLPIRFSKSFSQGGSVEVGADLRRVYRMAWPVLGLYAGLVAIFADPLLPLIFGEGYASQGTLVRVYDVAILLSFLAIIPGAALKGMREARNVFNCRAWATAVGVPVGVGLIYVVGVTGAAAGMLITYGLYALLLRRETHRLTRDPAQHDGQSSAPLIASQVGFGRGTS